MYSTASKLGESSRAGLGDAPKNPTGEFAEGGPNE